ncbi:hypothetical protein RR11_1020 [Ruegeria sp. R11]|nr:hypothetical protein RR11_1020 [Ruegeria sp. R11]
MHGAASVNWGSEQPCGGAEENPVSALSEYRLLPSRYDRLALAANDGSPPFL